MAKYQLVLEKVANKDSEAVPVARSGHRCVTDGVFLYSFGGFNPNNVYSKLFDQNICCFHLSSRKWYTVITASYGFGRAPKCVASSAMVLDKGRLIVFGGSGYPFGMCNSNDIFSCDLIEQRWIHFDIMEELGNIVPEPGYGQGFVMGPDNCMYVFGGTKGLVYNNDLHKFDFDTKQWELIPCRNPPSARYRHEMVSIDNGFIVIGGYGRSGACQLDKLPVYSYASSSWKEVKTEGDELHGFPEPRRAHSCVKFKDNVYVCGGFREESSEMVHDDLWKLNVRTFSWSMIPKVLPHPTYFHSAAVTREGCMYIFGGITWIREGEVQRTNNVFKMWLVIPTLERLCWEALCDNIPENARLDTKKLGNFGVPKSLLASYDAQFHVGLENDDM